MRPGSVDRKEAPRRNHSESKLKQNIDREIGNQQELTIGKIAHTMMNGEEFLHRFRCRG